MDAESGPSDAELLRAAVADLAASGRFPIAFGGFVDRGAITVSSLVGHRQHSLEGLRVESDRGLGGRAMAEGRPRVTTDYSASPHITHDYDEAVLAEGIRSLFAVPVIVRRRMRGIIYGGTRSETEVGGIMASAAIDAARDLAVQLEVREEVERRIAAVRRTVLDEPSLSSAQLAELREGVAELRGIASLADDPALRDRIALVESRLAALAGLEPPVAPTVTLAPRELDVLGYVAIGASNAQIAQRLELAESTVKAYMSSAMVKLGAGSRFEAVQRARAARLIP